MYLSQTNLPSYLLYLAIFLDKFFIDIRVPEPTFIISGKLRLGIRYSRAKQRSLYLLKNNSFMMQPGTMHMRMAVKNTIILEMSTKDEDNDSIIVEDGLKYKFHEIR